MKGAKAKCQTFLDHHISGKISHKMVGCTLKNWSLHTPSTLDSLLTWITSRVEGVFDAESISSGS